MSHQMKEMSDEKQGKVEVNDLPREQEELTDEEAKQTKGGGGMSGGVLKGGLKPIGEEIPQ